MDRADANVTSPRMHGIDGDYIAVEVADAVKLLPVLQMLSLSRDAGEIACRSDLCKRELQRQMRTICRTFRKAARTIFLRTR